MFITTAVIGYQLAILAILIAVKGSLAWAGVLTLWTLTHIFFPPLMMLQFGTIILGVLIGKSMNSD